MNEKMFEKPKKNKRFKDRQKTFFNYRNAFFLNS